MANPISTFVCERISERELFAYRAEVKSEIFRQIRKTFAALKASPTANFNQKSLAFCLGIDEAALSRRLNGKNDFRLETLSDLARGLGCRIDIKLTPIADVVRATSEMRYWSGGMFTEVKIFNAEPPAQVAVTQPTYIQAFSSQSLSQTVPQVINSQVPGATATYAK